MFIFALMPAYPARTLAACTFFLLSLGTAPAARASSEYFRIYRQANAPATLPPVGQDCRSLIAARICLVEPAKEGDLPYQRPCLKTEYPYEKPIEAAYDQMPADLRQAFCHLSRIFVEKDFTGSAYGSLFTNEWGQVTGGMVGIREAILRELPRFDTWASWKEQVHFGADPGFVHEEPGLPRVRSSLNEDPYGTIYFLLVHELAHVIDFTNAVNQRHSPATSWPRFSWQTEPTDQPAPRPEHDFPLRPKLCYYFCGQNFIDPARQGELYSAITKTNFITPYATRFPTEDFAETFAFYVAARDRGLRYRVGPPGAEYDAAARLRSPELRAKIDFIEQFLAKPYRYPGT